MFGGGGGQEYKVRFQNAGQLVNGNQVQIAGKGAGKITEIELTEDNQAEVTVTVNDEFAPLHEGTTAIVRVISLPSIANRNISLASRARTARAEIEEGGMLDDRQDDHARRPRPDLQHARLQDAPLAPERAAGLLGLVRRQGRGAQRDLQVLEPGARDDPAGDAGAGRRPGGLRASSSSMPRGSWARSSERRDDVAGFVTNTNPVFRAIGDENVEPRPGAQLPARARCAGPTPRSSSLRGALDELDELTNVTKPFADDLAPFFRRLEQARSDARRRPSATSPTRSDCASGQQRLHRHAARPAGARRRLDALVPELDQRAEEVAEGDRVHPALRTRLHRLDREVRAHDRASTTPTATTPACSRSSAPSRSPRTAVTAC